MEERLLQVLPSIIRRRDNELEIDVDFCESLRLYLDNFYQVSVACSITTEITDSGLRRCRPVKELPWQNRVELIPLPNTYHLSNFVRHYHAVRRVLKAEIENADYLLFSPHALGDWPTVATHEAVKLQRPYVIDADVVYDEVARVAWSRTALWNRLVIKNIELALFQRSYRYCLEHSSVALLQGQDVYSAYAPFCRNPHKVYHMPVSKEDYITELELRHKLDDLNEIRALRICYVGRAIDMKGPTDWLKTLQELIKSGIEISATWLGDGSLLPSMRIMAENFGMTGNVKFPGYVDHEKTMRTLRDSDIFLFCHKTRESPRCLIEALASGCPLVGYGSAYPEDIVAQRGGGQFAAVGNWQDLANIVKDLNKNREKLRELIKLASATGRLYERDATMQRRIDLIRGIS